VRLSRLPDIEDATIDYTTESRTAVPAAISSESSGTLYLNANRPNPDQRPLPASPISTTKSRSRVLGDSLVEGNEYFVVRLTSAGGVTIADSIGTCVIVNDEKPRFFLNLPMLYIECGWLSPAFADMDRDGDQDLPSEVNMGNARFGLFDGVTNNLQTGDHHGCAWGDYDKDGLPDLIVMGYDSEAHPGVRTKLLHNLGFGQFEDVAPALGMDVIGNGETAVWGDFDGDGWPDLFAPYYGYVPPYRSMFYRNRGDGTFEETGGGGRDRHDRAARGAEARGRRCGRLGWQRDARSVLREPSVPERRNRAFHRCPRAGRPARELRRGMPFRRHRQRWRLRFLPAQSGWRGPLP
jgi:hypothetical protein